MAVGCSGTVAAIDAVVASYFISTTCLTSGAVELVAAKHSIQIQSIPAMCSIILFY